MAFFVYLVGSAEVTPDLHHNRGHHCLVVKLGRLRFTSVASPAGRIPRLKRGRSAIYRRVDSRLSSRTLGTTSKSQEGALTRSERSFGELGAERLLSAASGRLGLVAGHAHLHSHVQRPAFSPGYTRRGI